MGHWIALAGYLLVGVADVAMASRAMKKKGIRSTPFDEWVVGVMLWPAVWIVLLRRAAARRQESRR
ncbi:MAG TPA: hypothetical protein VGS97_19995 [Actinocrinis sp.]|uniref:hypothetical protein n=1 Tax=Actinocrinis sp. TaxID=1920516 RepID=UPI002DDD0300|nr:hypothetical protein [Actinocrinis sp.]HEV2346391.1 hypothetical protein [Actinocrinis sp.]